MLEQAAFICPKAMRTLFRSGKLRMQRHDYHRGKEMMKARSSIRPGVRASVRSWKTKNLTEKTKERTSTIMKKLFVVATSKRFKCNLRQLSLIVLSTVA